MNNEDKKDEGITPATLRASMNYLRTGDPKHLRNAIIASTPGGIEQQEREGTQEAARNGLIPRDIRGWWPERGTYEEQQRNRLPDGNPRMRKVLEDLGFKLKTEAACNGDHVLMPVELPPGWSIRTTDHAMWNDVVDEKGRKRMGMFYKAAFYDRSAHAHFEHRFTCDKYNENGKIQLIDKQDGKVLWSIPVPRNPADWKPSPELDEWRNATMLAEQIINGMIFDMKTSINREDLENPLALWGLPLCEHGGDPTDKPTPVGVAITCKCGSVVSQVHDRLPIHFKKS